MQIKRGSKAKMPTLKEGEFGYCLDTKELYIGNTSGSDKIGNPVDSELSDTSENPVQNKVVKSAIENIKTVKTSKEDGTETLPDINNTIIVDSVLSDESTNPVWNKTIKAAIDNVNVNTLGVSHKNLLDNWDFRNPVNQRGLTEYSSEDYTIDRWKLLFGTHFDVFDGYMKLYGLWGIIQIFEKPYPAGTYTLSVRIRNTTSGVRVGVYSGDSEVYVTPKLENIASEWTTINSTFNAQSPFDRFLISGTGSESDGADIQMVKLEIGSVSTLANDPPADYGEELRKCQRYYWKSGTGVKNAFILCPNISTWYTPVNVRFPVKMRTIPSVNIYSSLNTKNAITIWASSVDAPLANIAARANTLGEYGFNTLQTSDTFATGTVYSFHVEAIADL